MAKRSPTETDLNNAISSGLMEVSRTDLVEHEGCTDQVRRKLGSWSRATNLSNLNENPETL